MERFVYQVGPTYSGWQVSSTHKGFLQQWDRRWPVPTRAGHSTVLRSIMTLLRCSKRMYRQRRLKVCIWLNFMIVLDWLNNKCIIMKGFSIRYFHELHMLSLWSLALSWAKSDTFYWHFTRSDKGSLIDCLRKVTMTIWWLLVSPVIVLFRWQSMSKLMLLTTISAVVRVVDGTYLIWM